MYNEQVIEHFEAPRNVATPADLAGSSPTLVSGEGGNEHSGVWIGFWLDVEGMTIRQARFRAYGCPHTLAMASWLTERLVGEPLTSGYTLPKDEIVAALALPAEKLRSVLVAEDALRDCATQIHEGQDEYGD